MKRPYLFVSVFLCSVLLPFITLFCGIPCCRSVLGQEPCGKAVTTNPAFQYYPQIWGTNILWLKKGKPITLEKSPGLTIEGRFRVVSD
ncbi:MAG: hypothetical protein AABZ62_00780 [Planctomycetota bacterium]